MNEEMLQQVLTRMDTLASKLGVAGEHIYQAAIKQSYIAGWMSVFSLVGVVVGMGVLLTACHKVGSATYSLDLKRHSRPDVGAYWFPYVFTFMGGIIVLVLTLLTVEHFIGTALTNWYNPEWAAIKRLKP